MSDDVIRRYNGARPIQAPAQLLADAIREVEILREENARLLKENSELLFRAHALLWLLPPEITCGELQKARDEMLAATIREGGKDE